MNTLIIEIQPTEGGDEASWRWFLMRKLLPPSLVEKKLKLTVQLTDAISAVLKISTALDPACRIGIKRYSGFLIPDFTLSIESDKFQIQAEKAFKKGASRQNVFNSRVALTVRSVSEAWLKLFEKSYWELGPKPLFANYDCSL
jgi:hypothetical protein